MTKLTNSEAVNSNPYIGDGTVVWMSGSSLVSYNIATGTRTTRPVIGSLYGFDGHTALLSDGGATYLYNLNAGQMTQIANFAIFQGDVWGAKTVLCNYSTTAIGNPYHRLFLHDNVSQSLTQIDNGPTRNMNPSIRNGLVVWEHYTNWPNSVDPDRIYFYDGVLHENISQTQPGQVHQSPDIAENYVVWCGSGITPGEQVLRYRLFNGMIEQISSGVFGTDNSFPDADGERVVWQSWVDGGTNIVLFDGGKEHLVNPSPIPQYKLPGLDIYGYVNPFPQLGGDFITWSTTDGKTRDVFLAAIPEPATFSLLVLGGLVVGGRKKKL